MRRIVILAIGLALGVFAGPVKAAPGDFAAGLYANLPKDQNLICSPLSIYEALAMTRQGAAGTTAAQMDHILGPDAQARQMIAALTASDPDFQLHIANALWVQNGFDLLPQFRDTISKEYQGACNNVDFANPADACMKINSWVSDQTSGKIPELFSPGSVPHDARLVLTNAIYFHADWKEPFTPEKSFLGDFHAGGHADPAQRMMMHKLGSYRVMHDDQFDALELPYKGDKISMLIVLPKKMDGLAAVESEMTGPMIDRIAAGMDSHFLALSLPKFQFSFQTSLQTALKAMGITAAFKRDEADFSGIDGRRDLFVADAVHKAFIAVDEAGTEAAAASGIVMMPTAIPLPREAFTIDHPFLFMIRDNSSGAVLFMGRVLDPGSN